MTFLLGKLSFIPLTCTEMLQREVFCLSHLLAPAISLKARKKTNPLWDFRSRDFYFLKMIPRSSFDGNKGAKGKKSKKEAIRTFV